MFPVSRISPFTGMNSIGPGHGSKLPGAVLGAAIIGLSLAPLPATAGTSIDHEIEAALAAASTARAAYTSYSTAAADGCLTLADNTVICVVPSSEQRVADTATRAVYTPPRR